MTGSLPSRSKADYRLNVDGLVDNPMTLTYDEILAMKPIGLTRDFQCVTGWRVHSVPWVGVKLADVLDRVGAQANAAGVTFGSFDGAYTESLSMAQARRDDVHGRVPPRGQGHLTHPRRSGAALRRADVRLQVDQVARPHHD